jgi:Fur family transcriptional regulator, zinc uptake regulator
MREKRPRHNPAISQQTTVEESRSFEELALRQLRANGYRITMPRVQVIRALADTDQALSAYAIHEKIINSGGKIDVVSVYRILGTLQEVGLIHHIGVADGYFPCRMDDAHSQDSAHFVCEKTGIIKEMPVLQDIRDALHKQADEIGFIPTVIKIEIVGLSAQASEQQS